MKRGWICFSSIGGYNNEERSFKTVLFLGSPFQGSFVHWKNSKNTDLMIQITCYVIISVLSVFLTVRGFLSILQSSSCYVLTLSFLVVGIDHLIDFLRQNKGVDMRRKKILY